MENNALSNKFGAAKLNEEEKALYEKLEEHGVQSADEFNERWLNCATDVCKQEVFSDYAKADEESNQIILEMWESGKLNRDEYELLTRTYADKMLEGAAEGDSEYYNRGVLAPVYEKNAMSWWPAFLGPNLSSISSDLIEKRLREDGASEETIKTRLKQVEILNIHLATAKDSKEALDIIKQSGLTYAAIITGTKALAKIKTKSKLNNKINNSDGAKQAKKLSKEQKEQVGEMVGNKDWHNKGLKESIRTAYKKQLKGSKNFDFYKNKKTGEVFIRGNQSGSEIIKIDLDKFIK